MCELLGMSANVPTDICFSFAGLRVRGGKTGPHKDGWGVAMYRDGKVWSIHDPRPSADSDLAEVISKTSIKCDVVICHIRQANVGEVCLPNTHPFYRQQWNRTWSYAHNGQLEHSDRLKTVRQQASTVYRKAGVSSRNELTAWFFEDMLDPLPAKVE